MEPKHVWRLALICVLVSPASAWAYIDPNAGGMLFQLLAPLFAALLGAWMFLRRWIAAQLQRLWNLLRGKRQE